MSKVRLMLLIALVALTTMSCEVASLLGQPNPEPTAAPTKVASAPTQAAPTGKVQPTAPTQAAPTGKVQPTDKPAPTATSAPVPAIKPLRMNSPEMGVQAFLWWRPETADRDLGLARDAGFTWVKQQFAWRDIEGAAKGKFIWDNADQAVRLSNQKGLDLLARIDNAPDWAAPGCFNEAKKQMGPAKNMQDWLDFLTAFVTRYKGRIRAYEIWNEPNLAREWCGRPPSPSEYAQLLKQSYAKIKSIDPNAMIISAGLTPTTRSDDVAMPDAKFLEQMYTAMNNKSDGYFDVLGIHAPGFKAPPEMSPDDVGKSPAYSNGEGAAGRIYSFRHAEDMRNIMVARGDTNKQIAILEFGWTTDSIHPAYSWFKVDEQTQATYILNAYDYAKKNWSSWIGLMSLIYIANPDWTKDSEEYWWSITQPNGDPRATWVRLNMLYKQKKP